jgi:hypothetical protein
LLFGRRLGVQRDIGEQETEGKENIEFGHCKGLSKIYQRNKCMIFHGIQKKRPHKRAAHVIATIIQFYKTLFFTPQKMDLESNTYGESIAAVGVVLALE